MSFSTLYGKMVEHTDIVLSDDVYYYAVGRSIGDDVDVYVDVYIINDYAMLYALKISDYPFKYYKTIRTDSEMCGDEINNFVYIDKDDYSSLMIEDIINRYDLKKTPKEIIKLSKICLRDKKLKRILKDKM